MKPPVFFFRDKAAFKMQVRDSVQKLADRQARVTWDEFTSIHAMNAAENRVVVANLDDDALCKLYDVLARNSKGALPKYEHAATNAEMIERQLAPLLATRLREYLDAKKECE